MAITNDEQLSLAVKQVHRLHKAIAVLRRDTKGNIRNFSLLVEGPTAQLEAIQQEIAEYTGLVEIEQPG